MLFILLKLAFWKHFIVGLWGFTNFPPLFFLQTKIQHWSIPTICFRYRTQNPDPFKIFSTWIWCSRNDLVLVVENARTLYVVVLHTMTQWNRRLVQQKWCPSKHQDPSFDQHFFASFPTGSFWFDAKCIAADGFRKIHSKHTCLGVNCAFFFDTGQYFLYFLYLLFGVANGWYSYQFLGGGFATLVESKLTAFRGSSLAPCYHGEVSTWELAWGWVLVHCCLAWVLQLHDCRIVRHSQVGMDGWIWIWQSSNLLQDWLCYMDMICVFDYMIIYNIHIIAYTHSFIFMLTHP